MYLKIFSTAEFRPLHQLRILDLSGNKIKALEEGIFKGCENLQVSFKTSIVNIKFDTKRNKAIQKISIFFV